MRHTLLIAALALSAGTIPAAAQAQRLPAAVIAVVDTARIGSECTACRAAATQMQSRATTLRTRATTLQQQLQTEGKPIQDAVNALNGRQPDAALQQRITAFQTKQQSAQTELENGQRNLQSIQLHVQQQIGTRLGTIVNSVAAARGATVALDKGAILYNAPNIEITNEVLAQLNQQLPAVSVTPLPQQQQTPTQGR